MCYIVVSVCANEVTFLTPMEMNLGEMESGRVIEGVIQFVNTGNDSVKISGVRTSCGCTVVETQKKTYAPGDTASIPFKLNTRGFKGKVHKSITIQFENEDPPTKLVKLIAHCLNYLECDPRYLAFTQIRVNQDTLLERQIRLTNHYKEPIRIQSIECEIRQLKIQFKNGLIQPDEKMIIIVELTPDQAYRKSSRLRIKTDNPRIEPIYMPVYVNIQE